MPGKVSDASVLGDFSHWLAELAKTSCRHHFTDHCNLNHVFHCSIWTFTLRNGFKRCSAPFSLELLGAAPQLSCWASTSRRIDLMLSLASDPQSTESLRRQARCMQRSKAWALSWFYLHGILQAPVFQSPHSQHNMSKSFKINPWKLMNNEDHPPTLWEEVCFMPRCWGLGHKGRCQGQTESQPSQIPAGSLLRCTPINDWFTLFHGRFGRFLQIQQLYFAKCLPGHPNHVLEACQVFVTVLTQYHTQSEPFQCPRESRAANPGTIERHSILHSTSIRIP